MKKYIVILTVVVAGFLAWSCSKVESGSSLKQALEKGVADINSAIGKISTTKGYQMLTITDDQAKSGDGSNAEGEFKDSITLELVAGIYDFQPEPVMRDHFYYPYRLFEKTGTSDKMIVNLPEKLIFHPKYLRNIHMPDSLLENNFTISASDYHFYYNWWNSYDYKLVADFTLDSDPLGSLELISTANSFRDNSSFSSFTFTEGYRLTTSWETGDTSETSFALMQDDDILLKESRVFIWQPEHKGERQYILTIGNVEIKKTSGVDSIQVYLDGVLQQEAAAVITDDSDTTGTICHKRDILLTFDDGTTARLSEMISPALEALKELIDSLHSMYFSKHIVDYIAFSIYFNEH